MGEQRLYAKAEPAGKLKLGRLQPRQISILVDSLRRNKLSPQVLDTVLHHREGDLKEIEGLLNTGEDGERGNLGQIKKFHAHKTPNNYDYSREQWRDGVYLQYLALSKGFVDFSFYPAGTYEPKLLQELSLELGYWETPGYAEHPRYGILEDYNLVVGYQYDGQVISEYNGVDGQDFEPYIVFFIHVAGDSRKICAAFGEAIEIFPEGSDELLERMAQSDFDDQSPDS